MDNQPRLLTTQSSDISITTAVTRRKHDALLGNPGHPGTPKNLFVEVRDNYSDTGGYRNSFLWFLKKIKSAGGPISAKDDFHFYRGHAA